MTGEVRVPLDQHPCDLCPRPGFRSTEIRNMGVDWIDGYWLCAECIDTYDLKLRARGSRVLRTRNPLRFSAKGRVRNA
jgi:hypothetical protein